MAQRQRKPQLIVLPQKCQLKQFGQTVIIGASALLIAACLYSSPQRDGSTKEAFSVLGRQVTDTSNNHDSKPTAQLPINNAINNNNSNVTTPTKSTTTNNYTWLSFYDERNSLQNRIATPMGYTRENTTNGSFAEWLRGFPLKAGKPPVKLYNGQLKGNQTAQYAVLDIDVGNTDLQQCADAVMRLRAEYLYATKRYEAIHFNYTNGFKATYQQWQQGKRPKNNGNSTTWVAKAQANNSYTSFRQYLNNVFNYAGTYSLSKELLPITTINDIKIGDVFIKGGFPGHAVIVMDIATHPQTGQKIFLLAQSYMPAQEIHLLVNPNDATLSPWYSTDFGTNLKTPEWDFARNTLARFGD